MDSAFDSGNDLYTQSLLELADRFGNAHAETEELPADWLEKNFIIPTPRDPITGIDLPAGPIRLADHQRRIVNEALSKVNGRFKYTTVIYSAPKKSGKSALSSGVALYMAQRTPYGQIYCLANDGKQSSDRLYLPIWRCLNFHQQRGLALKSSKVNQTEAFLPNYAHIEAIPCDAAGEAGSEPTGVFFSEIWGYTDEKKRRLFTELTIPPTLYGKAIRWIESYAGYIGVSDLLHELYTAGVKEGEPHPDFTDLVGRDGEPVVWVNNLAHTFVYWDTIPRMVWQSDEYYKQEAQILSPAEFARIHQNQWVSPVGSYIQPEWWDGCADPSIPELMIGSDVPCILGVDAALTGDCAAIVLVTRHPFMPDTDIAVRYVKIFKASPSKPINIEEDIGREIRRLAKLYNIVCIAYDSYQMEGLVQNYRRGNVVLTNAEIAYFEGKSKQEMTDYLDQEQRAAQRWFYKFGQQAPRAVADKRLYDMVVGRRIHYNPHDVNSDINSRANDETLDKHIKQAGVKSTGNQMRIEKLSNDAKVDGAVALSMATDRCMVMALDNREMHVDDLLRLHQAGKITYEVYLKRIQDRRLGAAFNNGR